LLKKRLITIVEKFKLKAENPQLTWMGEENIHYAVDEFEMAIKIILSDDPHLAPLAERFMVFLEARNAESDMQATSLEGNLQHGYSGLIRNSLMDFKSEMNSETHFVLQKFNNNQTKELCKVVWSIISRLDATEQLETLFEAFDDFRRDIKVIKEERENKLKKAKTEQLKLKTTCAYVDYLSGEHKKLEKQVKNVQSCFEKIEKGFHSTLAMQTIDSAANKTRLKSNENLSAATLCSINGKSANMMKENEQRAKVSTGQETDCQIIQKKGSFKQGLMNLGLKLGFRKQVSVST
uniref:FH2 domain-containing protein n=1 Tax=Brugia timori TaxID=42155 RepID=A0A0R3R1A3_9BILA